MISVEIIRAIETFKDLPENALISIANASEQFTLRRGQHVTDATTATDCMFSLTRGRIVVYNTSSTEQLAVTRIAETGSLLDVSTLFAAKELTEKKRALVISTVTAMPYRVIKQVCIDHPNILWRLSSAIVQQLHTAQMQLADKTFLDVTGRTAKQLLLLSGGEDEFSLPVTQEELAGIVGASRERVNKAIAALHKLGWIARKDRSYTILNKSALLNRARI